MMPFEAQTIILVYMSTIPDSETPSELGHFVSSALALLGGRSPHDGLILA